MHNLASLDLPASTPKPRPPTVSTPAGYAEGAWGLPIKAIR
jgi:hypothetical protein